MPVIFRFGPYRFWFWANENVDVGEPPHVHVRSADGWAVFWLDPVRLRTARGYTAGDIDRIRRIVVARRNEFRRRWFEFFGRPPTR
ncbi:MAG: DUF4160 domain-containing protein [Acidimicrobiales bacterium]